MKKLIMLLSVMFITTFTFSCSEEQVNPNISLDQTSPSLPEDEEPTPFPVPGED